jgi:hypothetical protein
MQKMCLCIKPPVLATILIFQSLKKIQYKEEPDLVLFYQVVSEESGIDISLFTIDSIVNNALFSERVSGSY